MWHGAKITDLGARKRGLESQLKHRSTSGLWAMLFDLSGSQASHLKMMKTVVISNRGP